jgi:hypothetical protein
VLYQLVCYFYLKLILIFSLGEFDKWLTEEQFDCQSTSELNYDEPYVKINFSLLILNNLLLIDIL